MEHLHYRVGWDEKTTQNKTKQKTYKHLPECRLTFSCSAFVMVIQVPWQTHDALFELLQVPQDRHLERQDADITVFTPLENWQASIPDLGSWTIIDLGSGSGLVGKLFRQIAQPEKSGRIVGVDISPKMVDLCRDKGWYDELHVADIHDVLSNTPAGSSTMVNTYHVWFSMQQLHRNIYLFWCWCCGWCCGWCWC